MDDMRRAVGKRIVKRVLEVLVGYGMAEGL
jgi:hypothetical protein